MKDRQKAVLDAVQRAQQLLDENAALLTGLVDRAGARHGGGRTTLVIPGLAVDARIHSRVLAQPLAARRGGVMLHYDDSSRDDWALEWFQDPRCRNGYTWLVLDDGGLIELADPAHRTPHAGPCLVPRANSAFYGISAATDGLVPATPAQLETIVRACVALFRYHGWRGAEAADRIVGHDAQAVWTPEYTRAAGIPESRARLLWGTLGRKVDPTGVRADGRKIIDVRAVQSEVARRLGARPAACHPERSEGSALPEVVHAAA
jgi:N-acetylmuramoyl-L-alanine amidase-like protein